jgi:hypothetical protein
VAALAPDALEALPLLDGPACAAVVDAVLALHPHWLQRHPAAPFFTLGVASYLDATDDGRALYEAAAAQQAPLLDEAFGPLYQKVTATLAQRLGEPVALARRQARPGFHVFLADPAFEEPVARVHCDLQHALLDWDGRTPEATLSFTLALELPAAGGGMDVWALRQAEWLALTPAQRLAAMAEAARRDIAYAPGELVLHSGELVHRIAATPLTPTDRRITLQGHGVRLDGRWQLYW